MRDVIFEDDSISLIVLPLSGAVLVRRTQATGVGNRRVRSELTLTHAELDALCTWWAKKIEEGRAQEDEGKQVSTRIEIELIDGTVLPNDPDLGWNLSDVHDIKECLRETGHYRITIPGRSGMVVISANEVKEIREVEG